MSPSDFVLQSSENLNGQEVTSLGNKNRFISPEREPSDHTSVSQLQTYPELGSAALANHNMELIFRALPRPLATYATLAKMWNGQCTGAEEIVRSTILAELDLIVYSPEDLDESMLLAVL
ncbi:hypothetical protein N7493_000878 [Penicillium malachiteum]|uniref:Uncharacterized protein n=1 Tax=Penicillium malachiteum TaxID=1324776 RepID=A0AAD6HXR3_9EURO|nr:hypothetical protein N7493_000878 [Penicillium malachiteum]